MKQPTTLEVLNQVTELAGDGYVVGESVIQNWRLPRREAVRALRRAISGGYLLELRGLDMRAYVAVAQEGWRLIEDSESSVA